MPNEKPSILYIIQSRKFWATLTGIIMMIVTSITNKQAIDPDTLVNGIMILVSVYVAAVALEDGLTARDAGTTRIQAPAGSDVTLTASAPPSTATTTTTVTDTGNTGPQTVKKGKVV